MGDALGLRVGEMYRISYSLGAPHDRRMTRSLAVYEGAGVNRMWDGRQTVCLRFQRPQGRPLHLLRAQIVDLRPATLNDRGQLVLVDAPGQRRRRRVTRRYAARPAW